MSALNAPSQPASLEEERRAHEPSMEEILASIRRIIADDDTVPSFRRDKSDRRGEDAQASERKRSPSHEGGESARAMGTGERYRSLSESGYAQDDDNAPTLRRDRSERRRNDDAAAPERRGAFSELGAQPPGRAQTASQSERIARYRTPAQNASAAFTPDESRKPVVKETTSEATERYRPLGAPVHAEEESALPRPREKDDRDMRQSAEKPATVTDSPARATEAADNARRSSHESDEPLIGGQAIANDRQAEQEEDLDEALSSDVEAEEFAEMQDALDLPEKEAPLMSVDAAASISAQFQSLAASMLINDQGLLQECARELLRPMLKAWLDDNLPVMVERLVRAEIERMARGARR